MPTDRPPLYKALRSAPEGAHDVVRQMVIYAYELYYFLGGSRCLVVACWPIALSCLVFHFPNKVMHFYLCYSAHRPLRISFDSTLSSFLRSLRTLSIARYRPELCKPTIIRFQVLGATVTPSLERSRRAAIPRHQLHTCPTLRPEW